MHCLVTMADGDDRSRDDPVQVMSQHSPVEELPLMPLDLRRPPVPPSSIAQGNLLPTVTSPSPIGIEPSPTLNVQHVGARQIHQQAVFVNQDRSAQVAEIAELRHQAQWQNRVNSLLKKLGSFGMS